MGTLGNNQVLGIYQPDTEEVGCIGTELEVVGHMIKMEYKLVIKSYELVGNKPKL